LGEGREFLDGLFGFNVNPRFHVVGIDTPVGWIEGVFLDNYLTPLKDAKLSTNIEEISSRYNLRLRKEGSCKFVGGTLGNLGWNERKVSTCGERGSKYFITKVIQVDIGGHPPIPLAQRTILILEVFF
jgi:hypothetical protein